MVMGAAGEYAPNGKRRRAGTLRDLQAMSSRAAATDIEVAGDWTGTKPAEET